MWKFRYSGKLESSWKSWIGCRQLGFHYRASTWLRYQSFDNCLEDKPRVRTQIRWSLFKIDLGFLISAWYSNGGNQSFNEIFWFLNGILKPDHLVCFKSLFISSVPKSRYSGDLNNQHLNISKPFDNRIDVYYWNIRHVQYSDPHCIVLFLLPGYWEWELVASVLAECPRASRPAPPIWPV